MPSAGSRPCADSTMLSCFSPKIPCWGKERREPPADRPGDEVAGVPQARIDGCLVAEQAEARPGERARRSVAERLETGHDARGSHGAMIQPCDFLDKV